MNRSYIMIKQYWHNVITHNTKIDPHIIFDSFHTLTKWIYTKDHLNTQWIMPNAPQISAHLGKEKKVIFTSFILSLLGELIPSEMQFCCSKYLFHSYKPKKGWKTKKLQDNIIWTQTSEENHFTISVSWKYMELLEKFFF